MLKNLTRKQIFIPIVALLLLALFNLIMDPGFIRSNSVITVPGTRSCRDILLQSLTTVQSLRSLPSE